MYSERPPRPEMDPAQKRAHELDGEEEVQRILESGDEGEVTELLAHIAKRKGAEVTREEFEMFRAFARQRRALIDRSDAETQERVVREPRATGLEYRVGAYIERIEPQVRDAVFLLREKGYASYESGFRNADEQTIGFDGPVSELASFVLSDDIVDAFRSAGAKPYVKEERVGFKLTRPLSDAELKTLWDRLASVLPTLETPRPLTDIPTAIWFREKQGDLFPRGADGETVTE